MKIALLFPNNIITSPYLPYYTQILKKQGIPFDLIIWNRQGIPEESAISYSSSLKSTSNLGRLYGFCRYRTFIIEKLKEGDYNKVIVFSCQLGILLEDFLIKKFNKKYILDIRDNSPIVIYFKGRFKKLLAHSHSICISSEGFKSWLPKGNSFIMSHNVNIAIIEKALVDQHKDKEHFANNIYNVDVIGQIKDYNSDKLIIDSLKNRSDFQMKFIGFGAAEEALRKYVEDSNIQNVVFLGPYKKSEELNLLKNTDFLNILVTCNGKNYDGVSVTANRLYLSAMLNIPCLVNSDTEHSRIINEYGFGIIIEDYKEIPEKINAFVENFNKDLFKEGCNNFLEKVKQDYLLFERNLNNFISSYI